MAKQLGKAELFNTAWPAPVKVDVPELDGEIYVRILSAGEMDELEGLAVTTNDGEIRPNHTDQRGRIVARCACDSAGVRIFSDDDEKQLSRLPMTYIDRIYTAALKANPRGAAAVEAAKKN